MPHLSFHCPSPPTIVVLAVILFIGAFGFIIVSPDYSLSSVMSSSMQHDNWHSQIGTIDTGDAVIVEEYSKALADGQVHSYIEGTIDGYMSFGDFGSVIVYNRSSDLNPIIHRAIVWLDCNQDGTWSIPSLKDYKGQWVCRSDEEVIEDNNRLSGTLTFIGITQSQKTVSINLDALGRQSGYLTMGDNPDTNRYFDQLTFQYVTAPISPGQIRSVAMVEIPWMALINVYMNETKRTYLSHVPNSINCLIMLFVSVIAFIYSFNLISLTRELRDRKLRDRKRLLMLLNSKR